MHVNLMDTEVLAVAAPGFMAPEIKDHIQLHPYRLLIRQKLRNRWCRKIKVGSHEPCSRPVNTGREHGSSEPTFSKTRQDSVRPAVALFSLCQ